MYHQPCMYVQNEQNVNVNVCTWHVMYVMYHVCGTCVWYNIHTVLWDLGTFDGAKWWYFGTDHLPQTIARIKRVKCFMLHKVHCSLHTCKRCETCFFCVYLLVHVRSCCLTQRYQSKSLNEISLNPMVPRDRPSTVLPIWKIYLGRLSLQK